jgi:hypothetical protein
MPRYLIATLALVTLLFAACSGGDKKDDADDDRSSDETPRATRTKAPSGSDDDSDLSKHEDELRETVPAAYKAIFAGGGVDAYKYASDDFKDKCKLDEFIGVIAIIKVFLGNLKEEDIEVEVTDIRYEDGKAYVDVTGKIQGEELSTSDEGDSFSDYWLYEDGDWKWGTDDAEPCDSGFDSSSSDDATPASGPGSSRTQPAPLGDAVETGDLRITILTADIDAADQLERLSDFPSTPEAGKRIVLARVKVEHIGNDGDETIQVYESDYKITGSNNVLYSSFDDGVSCGFIDDSLQGEMFPGGTLEGYVCFQVPSSETDLLLVGEPSFSFGSSNSRRFFALE